MSDDEKDVEVEDKEEKEDDKPAKGGKKVTGKKFEVKKWNAVALWAWGTLLLNTHYLFFYF